MPEANSASGSPPNHILTKLAISLGDYAEGSLWRGLATQALRVRGKYDEANPSDMVEYHVVRNGVDEEPIAKLLSFSFEKVEPIRYWSNHSMVIQRF
jgi:hypothetical protein